MNAEENRRILIIDDNESIHRDFHKVLAATDGHDNDNLDDLAAAFFGENGEKEAQPSQRATGFELDSASQGKEGLELLRRALDEDRRYALAFVDVRMPPGWDGVETSLRLWEQDPDLQIVICTAYSDYEWDELVQTLEHTDQLMILKKPFDAIEVQQMSASLCKKWQVERTAEVKMEELEAMVAERTREFEVVNARLERAYERVMALNEELRNREEKLHYLANHDALTDLPNRPHMLAALRKQFIRRERYDDYLFGLLFLDLDGFKQVNDTLGHTIGDKLLAGFAERLRLSVRTVDMCARLGGDEFVVLIEGIEGIEDLRQMAQRILEALQSPFILEGHEIATGASIGAAIVGPEHQSPKDLLRDADAAMYRAKRSGKNQYYVLEADSTVAEPA